MGGEHPDELEHDRDAGAVVVGAGGVAGEVQHVGDPGVQVPGDDVEPLRGRGALQRRDHVGDRGRHRDVGRDRLRERLPLHGHPPGRGGREGLHLIEHPAGGRADAALRVGLAGRRVPGAEADQLQDRRLDPGGVDFAQHRTQGGIGGLTAERGVGLGQGRTAEQRRRDRGDSRGGQERAAGGASAAPNILVLHPPNHGRHPSDVNNIATFANKHSGPTAWQITPARSGSKKRPQPEQAVRGRMTCVTEVAV